MGDDSLFCGNRKTGTVKGHSLGTFGDLRLDKGGRDPRTNVVCKTVCLKRLGDDRGGELGAGRFFDNPKVTADKIVDSWGQLTGLASCTGRHVLAIQDTTEVNSPTKVRRRRGPRQWAPGTPTACWRTR